MVSGGWFEMRGRRVPVGSVVFRFVGEVVQEDGLLETSGDGGIGYGAELDDIVGHHETCHRTKLGMVEGVCLDVCLI